VRGHDGYGIVRHAHAVIMKWLSLFILFSHAVKHENNWKPFQSYSTSRYFTVTMLQVWNTFYFFETRSTFTSGTARHALLTGRNCHNVFIRNASPSSYWLLFQEIFPKNGKLNFSFFPYYFLEFNTFKDFQILTWIDLNNAWPYASAVWIPCLTLDKCVLLDNYYSIGWRVHSLLICLCSIVVLLVY
jgi:hypothetical protein